MGMQAFLGKYNNLIYIQHPRIAKHKQRIETIAYYRITIKMDVYLFSRQKTNISSKLSVVISSCAKKEKNQWEVSHHDPVEHIPSDRSHIWFNAFF
jgi:hypothetical protein